MSRRSRWSVDENIVSVKTEPGLEAKDVEETDENQETEALDRVVKLMIKIVEQQTESKPTTIIGGNDVPEFDPECKTTSIDDWCKRVDQMKSLYKWTHETTTYFATCKLVGLAKTWYESQTIKKLSWDEWKGKLKIAFPEIDFNTLLLYTVHRNKRALETYTTYYFEKKLLLSRCNIDGKRAVSCIIGGIKDLAVRSRALAEKHNTLEEFYSYFIIADSCEKKRHKSNEKLILTSQQKKNRNSVKISYCYRCKKIGHTAPQCHHGKNLKPELKTKSSSTDKRHGKCNYSRGTERRRDDRLKCKRNNDREILKHTSNIDPYATYSRKKQFIDDPEEGPSEINKFGLF